jgi:hypothetical protein
MCKNSVRPALTVSAKRSGPLVESQRLTRLCSADKQVHAPLCVCVSYVGKCEQLDTWFGHH